jgi:mono/diheme cytochrome c family protein
MNRLNLTPRTIEMLVGILATAMIALGLLLYAIEEPQRIANAAEQQIQVDLEEAMTLYAENCSVCHGLAGEGIGSTPSLDSDALRTSDGASIDKIISRGLFNTAMPAWNKTDGGPLSDYQISELVALIQLGDWQATRNRVVNLGLAPRVPFIADPDPIILQQVAGLPDGEILVRAIQTYAGECVACHGEDGLGTALAPALNDPAVRAKSTDEIQRSILNGVAGTLMAPWNNTLSSDQVSDLVYLISHWDVVPAGAIPAPNTPVPVTAESLALGADLYISNCTRCHGPDGQGTQRAPALNVKSFLAETSDAAMEKIITLGVPSTAMPAWGDRLTDAEIQAVVGYLRSWEPAAPEVATPLRGPWWRTNGSTASETGNGPQMPSGGIQSQNQSAGSATDVTSQGGTPPPWAKQNVTPTWYENLDWRAWLLLGVLLSGSGGLMITASVQLRKLR